MKDLLADMLEKFKSTPSVEKQKLISDVRAWSEFCSQFYNCNEYDFSDLRRIFELYHNSMNKHSVVLLSCLDFKLESNPLNKLLKLLYNAKRKC